MDGIFESGDEYNPTKKRKILIVFDYMIVDILSYKKTSINSNRIVYYR